MSILPNENIKLFELSEDERVDNNVVEEQVPVEPSKVISVGDVCVKTIPSLEGEFMGERFYVIKAIIYKIDDYPLNSFIVKEVFLNEDGTFNTNPENYTGVRFSMSRTQCKFLNIEYEDGLQIFPIQEENETFKKYVPNPVALLPQTIDEFNEDDLSTYPYDKTDGTVKKIVLQLSGFNAINNTSVETPTHAIIPLEKFIQSFRVRLKETIPTINHSAAYLRGVNLPFIFVSRNENDLRFNVVSSDGFINLEIRLANENTGLGISKEFLNGKSIYDLIQIEYCDETMTESEMFRILSNRYDQINRRVERMTRHYNFGPM